MGLSTLKEPQSPPRWKVTSILVMFATRLESVTHSDSATLVVCLDLKELNKFHVKQWKVAERPPFVDRV